MQTPPVLLPAFILVVPARLDYTVPSALWTAPSIECQSVSRLVLQPRASAERRRDSAPAFFNSEWPRCSTIEKAKMQLGMKKVQVRIVPAGYRLRKVSEGRYAWADFPPPHSISDSQIFPSSFTDGAGVSPMLRQSSFRLFHSSIPPNSKCLNVHLSLRYLTLPILNLPDGWRRMRCIFSDHLVPLR